MIPQAFFKNISVTGIFLSVAAAIIFFISGRWAFGCGVLVSAAWVFLNSYFLFRLFQMGFETKAKMNDHILLFSILKFPVLYVTGFFILKSRVFPVMSVLTGLTTYFAGILLCWAKMNLAKTAGTERAV